MAFRTLRRLPERRVLAREPLDVLFDLPEVGEPGRRESWLLDARLVAVRVVLGVVRPAAFDEQPARQRVRQLGRRRVIRRRVPHRRRGLGIVPGLHVVAAELVDLVEVRRELRLRRQLPRHPEQRALDELVVDALAAVVVERAGDEVVHRVIARRPEEPQLVLHDRSALGEREVDDAVGRVAGREIAVFMPLRQVVALPVARTIGRLEVAAEPVAALARNHVQADATGLRVGANARGLVADLLVHRVVEVALDRAVALQPVDHHAVDQHRVLRRAHPVRRHVGLLHRARAARVGQAQVDADDQLTHALNRPAGRDRVDRFAVQHLCVHRRRHVDHRRVAGDRDRLLEGADAQVGVQRHRELGRQRDALSPDRRESGQREGDDVGAGTEVGDEIPPFAIGDGDLGFFNKCVARRLHRDAWQHGA